MTDSGNGAQLMYRIDLPTDDNGVVQSVIKEVALASSETVDVDLTVFNPARIWRIPGTMNCKGDDVPSRPHRMSCILSVPEKFGIVTLEQMETAASWKVVSNSETVPCREVSDFDLDSWIARFCPELGQPQVWKDGSIDELSSLPDYKITSFQYCQICLAFQSHMFYWMKKFAIRLSQPGKFFGIQLIVFPIAAVNQSQIPCMGNDYFKTKSFYQFTHPQRVSPSFHDNAYTTGVFECGKKFLDCIMIVINFATSL